MEIKYPICVAPEADKFVGITTYSTRGQAIKLWLPPITIWFSYDEPIAFRVKAGPFWISENKGFKRFPNGTKATGEHLNIIDPDHTKRMDRQTFLLLLNYWVAELL